MTNQEPQDWVSMVGAAQATTAPAVVTAAQTWSGAELLEPRRRRGPLAVRAAGCPSGIPVPALLQASPEALALVLAGAAVGGRSRRSVPG